MFFITVWHPASLFMEEKCQPRVDFKTSNSPKSSRPLTTYSCPSRPGR
ncbi:hypothetical protein [Thiolapillus sp.]